MNDIRLICFDIDGTLVHDEGSIYPEVLAEIQRVRDLGVQVCLATGRASFSARRIAELLDLDSPSLLSSGSLIARPISEEVLWAKYLEDRPLRELTARLRESGVYTELYTYHEYFIERIAAFTPIHTVYLKIEPRIGVFDDNVFNTRIVKVVTMVARGSSEERSMREILQDFPEFAVGISTGHAHPDILFFNITAPGAGREEGFQFLIEHYQVLPEQVAAFGDADSDIPFLRLAGHGVAMGNAPKRVKEAARHVTVSVDERGVAAALKRLIP